MLINSIRSLGRLLKSTVIPRRTFVAGLIGGAFVFGRQVAGEMQSTNGEGVTLLPIEPQEDVFGYIRRVHGGFDQSLYRKLLGACNDYKEGDETLGVAAADEPARQNARTLLARTRLDNLQERSVFEDDLSRYIQGTVDLTVFRQIAEWTVGDLRQFLLTSPEDRIKQIMPGLPSDVIGCVVKIMSNEQLMQFGSRLFNALPDSQIGARGYLGARIQPNSPTDHVEDIQWQVFNGFAFAVGDVLLGTNPVSSETDAVSRVESALAEILRVFELQDVLPHCVLAHIDVQSQVEAAKPGSTALWFQSLAGVEQANATFDISVPGMIQHAASRDGKYGLYFETGQGADATNGHGHGFDMVLHESRKYGFARALKNEVARAQQNAGHSPAPWVIANDVAGFIGPEIFRTREQLVRCCLEDIVMGKLHGLTLGLDICSTLHMEIDLDDLDWCIDQIMPACPAYLMALPTKNDPMLSYLTTAFQDHVRIRNKFGYRVNDAAWEFFQRLGVIDSAGQPTNHFGDPNWVYLQFRRAQEDPRTDDAILAEGRQAMEAVRRRGVFLAAGHGDHPWELEPQLDQQIRNLYADSKECIWAEVPAPFVEDIPNSVTATSQSVDRRDYVWHPPSGELLNDQSVARVLQLRDAYAGNYDVQIVVSDGLNAHALTDDDHLMPFLAALRSDLSKAGYRTAQEHIFVKNGRVRAGYRIGEHLFGRLPDRDSQRAILHVIGERPGSGHHAFSVYLTAPPARTWSRKGLVDHNISRVVSGIADTALPPLRAARDTVNILQQMAPLISTNDVP